MAGAETDPTAARGEVRHFDHFALTREDPDGVAEPRFVTLGLSNLGNLRVVVYSYREPDIIRIISAWKANKRQRMLYEKGRR